MQVVLISRGSMSSGQALANSLAERLSFRCVCREDLVKSVDSLGEYAKKVLKTIHTATRAYEQFSQSRRPYLILMRQALLRFIYEGDLIYHGHAGHLLIPDLVWCLRVRIDASMQIRTKNAIERLQLPEAEAYEAVLREDEAMGRWARFMYGKDIRDPKLYDTLFSLDRLSLEGSSAMIEAALKEKEFQPSNKDLQTLEDLCIAARAEAALVMDARLVNHEIRASSRKGQVSLEGPYLEESDLSHAIEIVRNVKGVREVDYQTGCAMSFDYYLR